MKAASLLCVDPAIIYLGLKQNVQLYANVQLPSHVHIGDLTKLCLSPSEKMIVHQEHCNMNVWSRSGHYKPAEGREWWRAAGFHHLGQKTRAEYVWCLPHYLQQQAGWRGYQLLFAFPPTTLRFPSPHEVAQWIQIPLSNSQRPLSLRKPQHFVNYAEQTPRKNSTVPPIWG